MIAGILCGFVPLAIWLYLLLFHHRFWRLQERDTGDLPEPETLVRASEEPPAHQADVLLRAAHGGQETPEEQLLRPVDR